MGNELYHYGVLGMRWGVRRTIRQLKRSRKQQAKEREEDRKFEKEMIRKSVDNSSSGKTNLSDMSDDDLAKKYNRLTLEKNVKRLMDDLDEDQYIKTLNKRITTIETERKYNSLTQPQKSTGRKFLDDVLPSVGKVAVGTVTTAALTAAVSKVLKFDKIEDAAKLVKK